MTIKNGIVAPWWQEEEAVVSPVHNEVDEEEEDEEVEDVSEDDNEEGGEEEEELTSPLSLLHQQLDYPRGSQEVRRFDWLIDIIWNMMVDIVIYNPGLKFQLLNLIVFH